VIILVLLNINLSQQLTLHCDFQIKTTYLGTSYGCIAKNLTTTFKNRKISKVEGNHQTGKTHSDVKLLFIDFQNVPYLPHNVGEFFPNLETFYILRSKVQHLIIGDLDGLDNLNYFDVSHNPVELIQKDFFKNHTKLVKFSFHDCHLKKIEKGALDSQKSIELLDLNYNDCISGRYTATPTYNGFLSPSLRVFLADAYDKCTGAGRLLKEQETIKECKIEDNESLPKDYGLVFKFGIAMICFLSITTVFLAYVTFEFYKKSFKSDWNEVNFNGVASNLNGNV
jgi:hypothetical protein